MNRAHELDKRNAEIETLSQYSAELNDSPAPPDPNRGWGVPHWHDKAAYPQADDIPVTEWRWEFLRRNHGYRYGFLLPEDKFRFCSKGLYFESVYALQEIGDPRASTCNVNDWSSDEATWWEGAPNGCGGKPGSVLFVDDDVRRKYAFGHEVERLAVHSNPVTSLNLRIDIRKPLGPQFVRLNAIAKDCQRSWKIETPRMHQALWPNYLRALDARDARASYSKISVHVLDQDHPSIQDGRDLVKRAEELRRSWPY